MKLKTPALVLTMFQASLRSLAPLVSIALCPLAHAAITVPGADGSDGALNITTDTVVDLSQAVTGNWDANNAANAGKGVYDPAKWAVVFKYTSVTVAAGKTLTFANHASRAPVVWLVSGDVTISGVVSLDGQNSPKPPLIAEPGPGGFRGGSGWYSGATASGAGLGVGGGRVRFGSYNNDGAGGSYGSLGNAGQPPYGNPSIVPLIGGSGGGGNNNQNPAESFGGGGGGGAILIACDGSMFVSGQIRANGGNGRDAWEGDGGAGSGGAIRLLASSLTGTGSLTASGGGGPYYGGSGRIRIERVTNTNTISVIPAPSVVDLATGATALLWPPVGAPEARVVSIGAVDSPADPKAAFGTYTPDVALPLVSSTQVVVETVNVEQASQVKVRITPRDNANFTEVAATYDSTVTTNPLTLRWTATVPTTAGYSAVQARVIRP